MGQIWFALLDAGYPTGLFGMPRQICRIPDIRPDNLALPDIRPNPIRESETTFKGVQTTEGRIRTPPLPLKEVKGEIKSAKMI